MSTEHRWQTEVGLANGRVTSTMRHLLAPISVSGPFSRLQNARITLER
jgi:hypothetical protein